MSAVAVVEVQVAIQAAFQVAGCGEVDQALKHAPAAC